MVNSTACLSLLPLNEMKPFDVCPDAIAAFHA